MFTRFSYGLVVYFFIITLSWPVLAQEQYFIDVTTPASAETSYDVELGDIDGDLDLDIIITNEGQNRLYINDGAGNYLEVTSIKLPVDNDISFDADFADVDGDLDLDIFITNRFSQNKLYINNGSGTFTDETSSRLPVDSDSSIEGAFGDIDGDGDLDILVVNNGNQNRLLINDGTGFFTDETASRLPAGVYADNDGAFGDIDGDLDLDIVIGCALTSGCQNRMLINDGSGIFTDETALRMPSISDTTPEIELGISDVDGDGDLDILVANGAGSGQKQNRILINNGLGYFTEETSTRLPSMTDKTFDIDLGDVDGDGDLDAVVANAGERNRLLINNGSGVYSDQTASRLPTDSDSSGEVDLGDVDGDGDLDIIVANRNNEQNRLFINDGTGNYTEKAFINNRLPIDSDISFDADFGDVDGDGDLDIFIANYDTQNTIYINDGTGTFTDETSGRLPVDSDRSIEGTFGDADGDGDLDILVVNNGNQNRLLINDGTGVFTDGTAGRLPIETSADCDAALGDVDDDLDLDIIVGNCPVAGGRNRLLINNGAGFFADETASRMPGIVNDPSIEVELGISDVDGDGDLDILVANGGGGGQSQNRIYINDGLGYFAEETSTRLPSLTDTTMDIDLGDVDADGDLDIVVANLNEQNRILINNGSGVYSDQTASRLPTDSDSSGEVDLGDVDGDGDLDIIVANRNNEQNRLFINDGTGNYTDETALRLPFDSDITFDIDFGDVDGDGDLDAIVSNNGQNRLYINVCDSCGVVDSDVDGVTNDVDLCPGTPAGEPVDADGCSSSQLDTDNDGVTDDIDLCPGTPAGEPVDSYGCSSSQLDTDNDGITNDIDLCPGTPAGEPVNANGCSESQIDSDGDGVNDDIDLCPGTPAGEPVDGYGCSSGQTDTSGPVTSDVVSDSNPVSFNTSIILTAVIDDSQTGGSNIDSAEYNINGSEFFPMSAEDGAYDSSLENVTTDIAEFDAGLYTICVRALDTVGNVGDENCIILAVYDPDGGFVTGGGWITSTEGAYIPDLSLTGKANFGFVSKYKNGANTPTGQTEFQFKVADLNFHSAEYEWLVVIVAGAKAKFKGVGTINGEGEYKFMISAIDADINESDSFTKDRFRIRIWTEDVMGNETVVYDNALGSDSDNDMTEIGGGSIVIHKEKNN